MKPVYESYIEIAIDDVYSKPRGQTLSCGAGFSEKREVYEEFTQERDILEHQFNLAQHAAIAGKDGYIGGHTNCAFSVLYEVFGVDVIAFLFDQAWVPSTTIDPFRPKQFLARLAVLESALGKLTEGDKLPVSLSQTASYRWPGIVPEACLFLDRRHGFFLRLAFRELREFGELGVRMHRTKHKVKVCINIWTLYGVDDEILAFAAEPGKHKCF